MDPITKNAHRARGLSRFLILAGFTWGGLVLCTPIMRYYSSRYVGPPAITSHYGLSPTSTLCQSRTVTKYVNPHGRKFYVDGRSVTFETLQDGRARTLSDIQILKRLCIGIWAGPVFNLEQRALRTLKRNWVDYDLEKKEDRGVLFMGSKAVGNRGILGFEMEKGDHLWGAFQVLDIEVRRSEVQREEGQGEGREPRSSYIDFAFGSSKPGSSFAGVHRFSVTRLPPGMWAEDDGAVAQRDGSRDRIKISFESYTCNPNADGSRLMDWLKRFHMTYANMLFSSGVSVVVQGVYAM